MRVILLHLIPASIYLLLGLAWWRSSAAAMEASLRPWTRALLLVALVLHGWGLMEDLFGQGTLRFGMADALSLTMWVAVTLYFLESFFARIEGLLALVMPPAAVSVFLPMLAPGQAFPEAMSGWAFRAHFIIAMLAYGVFTLAALHALMMSVAERQLHHARLAAPSLPPLLTLENLLFRLIAIAFVLLTLTVTSGVFFSEHLFGKALTFSHKTLFTIAAWMVFGVLLVGRHAWGWRGRVARRWTLVGTVCLLLAYLGTRFVLEVVLHRL